MWKETLRLAVIIFLPAVAVAQTPVRHIVEDFSDQDIFNNFSGDWNGWQHSPGEVAWSFETTSCQGNHDTCLRIDYSVPQGGFGGIWSSLTGKVDYVDQNLDFLDLYGDLNNSTGNPTIVENVAVTGLSFRAKGNGSGTFDHVVKVELKDSSYSVTEKVFAIPNIGDWDEYTFNVDEMAGVDLHNMKELVFVLTDADNSNRSSSFFIDQISLVTAESDIDLNSVTDDQFLDAVSQRAFGYFVRFTNTDGLALDRSTFSNQVSIGAVGFQLTAHCIGHRRGWANDLENRVEDLLATLASMPMGPEPGTVNAGYKGFFYHFLDARTGTRANDAVELSLYDTMLLMAGVLTAKECFPENANIQSLAQNLYDAVEWRWMVEETPGENRHQFHLAWDPDNGFRDYGHVDGYTDEALLVDVLALGSDTYPVTMESYNARSRHVSAYPPESPNELATAWTGSMFNYFFASCWLDLEPRGIDRHATEPLNIWENNRRAIVANRQFCIDHQDDAAQDGDDRYTTYGPNIWGLTAADNLVPRATGLLSEYYAFGALPTEQNIRFGADAPHVGTIAIYGPASAIVYTPAESIAALRHIYSTVHPWSPLLGFADSFSTDPSYYEINPSNSEPVLDQNGNLVVHPATYLQSPWINRMVMGIDEGPMLLAIENFRAKTVWELTNSNRNIAAGLDAVFGPLGIGSAPRLPDGRAP